MSTRIRFDVLTLFPEIFSGYLEQSLLKLAIPGGAGRRPAVGFPQLGYRPSPLGRRQAVRGRSGMLLSCQPVFDAVEAVQADAEEPGRW
ncbi:MAG: hypothetical protein CM1200mP2_50010 [Planctomycetaceae bacterium]|nr:MAG: hypothetical protein CM1200mP2_50010 [Planctomycetaceae bacterium]